MQINVLHDENRLMTFRIFPSVLKALNFDHSLHFTRLAIGYCITSRCNIPQLLPGVWFQKSYDQILFHLCFRTQKHTFERWHLQNNSGWNFFQLNPRVLMVSQPMRQVQNKFCLMKDQEAHIAEVSIDHIFNIFGLIFSMLPIMLMPIN